MAFLVNLELLEPERGVLIEGIPSFGELQERGVGDFLSPLKM